MIKSGEKGNAFIMVFFLSYLVIQWSLVYPPRFS